MSQLKLVNKFGNLNSIKLKTKSKQIFVKQIFSKYLTLILHNSFMLLQNTIMATPFSEDAFN